MAKDFKSSQIRVGKLIGSNSNQSEPKLIVYPDSSTLDGSGGINPNMLSNVGIDTFLFVSGSICGKKNNIPNSVTVFGGDVVISGSLYTERVDDSLWEIHPDDPDSLTPTNILDGDTGLFGLDFNLFVEEDGTIITSQYTMTNRENASDRYFEFDNEGNVMPVDEEEYNNLCATS